MLREVCTESITGLVFFEHRAFFHCTTFGFHKPSTRIANCCCTTREAILVLSKAAGVDRKNAATNIRIKLITHGDRATASVLLAEVSVTRCAAHIRACLLFF